MSKEGQVLKDIRFYSASILLTQVVSVVAAVLTRRFLGPTQMGVWAFLQVLLNYTEYSALGVITAAALEIPLYNGRGNIEKSRHITNIAFSFAFLSSFVVATGMIVYAFFKKETLSKELFYGLLMGAAFVLLQRFSGLVITIVRANKQFAMAGQQMFYSSILNVLLITFFSYRFKIYGFLVAMALGLLFNIIYLVWRAELRFRFVSDWVGMGGLVRYGFPLMTIGFVTTIFDTLDPLFITRFLGFKTLGLYSVALMTTNYLNGVPNSVGIVTISHLQEKYGATEDKTDLRQYLRKVDIGYGILMAVLIGAAWFLAPWLIRLFLPEFIGGIPSLQYLALSTYFTALAQGYSQLIYVIRKHNVLLVLISIACVVAVATNALALYIGYGVTGIAVATIFASFFYFTLLFFYGSLQVETLFEAFRRYLGLMGFFLVMSGLLFGVDHWIVTPSLVITPWVKTAVFALFLSPLLWLLDQEFGLSTLWPFRIFIRKKMDSV